MENNAIITIATETDWTAWLASDSRDIAILGKDLGGGMPYLIRKEPVHPQIDAVYAEKAIPGEATGIPEEYAGLYCRKDRKLYDVQEGCSFLPGAGNAMTLADLEERLTRMVRWLVEEEISDHPCMFGGRDFLDPARRATDAEVTEDREKIAKRYIAESDKEDGGRFRIADGLYIDRVLPERPRFHCDYKAAEEGGEMAKDLLYDCILDPHGTTERIAKEYMEEHWEAILAWNRAMLWIQREYKKLMARAWYSIRNTMWKVPDGTTHVDAVIRKGKEEAAFSVPVSDIRDDSHVSELFGIANMPQEDQDRFRTLFGCDTFAAPEIIEIRCGETRTYFRKHNCAWFPELA